jgi:hypothetical protein
VVSIPACHAGDRGSIPRRGGIFLKQTSYYFFQTTFLMSPWFNMILDLQFCLNLANNFAQTATNEVNKHEVSLSSNVYFAILSCM